MEVLGVVTAKLHAFTQELGPKSERVKHCYSIYIKTVFLYLFLKRAHRYSAIRTWDQYETNCGLCFVEPFGRVVSVFHVNNALFPGILCIFRSTSYTCKRM